MNGESPRGKLIRRLYEKAQKQPGFTATIATYGKFEDGTAIRKFTVTNREQGVSLIVTLRFYASKIVPEATLRVRTRGAGYRNIWRATITDESQLDEGLRLAASAAQDPGMSKTFLPDPWLFREDRFEDTISAVTLLSQISWAKVMRVVAVGDHGVMSTRLIGDPGRDCWYLLDCHGHRGAAFNIVSDGEVCYPTSRATNNDQDVRIARSINKATVDLTKCGLADKELVNRAIEVWLQQT